jgi:hypothetical protein
MKSKYSSLTKNRPKSAVVRKPLQSRLSQQRDQIKDTKQALKAGVINQYNEFRNTHEDKLKQLQQLQEQSQQLRGQASEPSLINHEKK